MFVTFQLTSAVIIQSTVRQTKLLDSIATTMPSTRIAATAARIVVALCSCSFELIFLPTR